eukprot:9989846-Lingulodinium_polyedra.AAC.1
MGRGAIPCAPQPPHRGPRQGLALGGNRAQQVAARGRGLAVSLAGFVAARSACRRALGRRLIGASSLFGRPGRGR